MQTPKHPTRFVSSRLALSLIVLSLLALTFAPATAREGVVVSWTDGTTETVSAPVAADAIAFGPDATTTQLRLVDVEQATRPATVIDFALDDFRPLRLAVYDLEGRLVRELADGLWAEGPHRMAWHHENEAGEVLEAGVYVVRMSCGEPADTRVALAR